MWGYPVLLFLDKNETTSPCLCLQMQDFAISDSKFPFCQENCAPQGTEDKARISCGGGPNCTIKSSAQNVFFLIKWTLSFGTCPGPTAQNACRFTSLGKFTHISKSSRSFLQIAKIGHLLACQHRDFFDMSLTVDKANKILVNVNKMMDSFCGVNILPLPQP